MQAILFTDGASKGNPGHSGVGCVLKDRDGKNLDTFSEYIGETTNNVAEYKAVINGLQMALNRGIKRLVCVTDSNLVVEQISGKYKIKAPHLKILLRETLEIANKFDKIEFNWIPREQNQEADELSKAPIENHLKENPVLDSILKKHNFNF